MPVLIALYFFFHFYSTVMCHMYLKAKTLSVWTILKKLLCAVHKWTVQTEFWIIANPFDPFIKLTDSEWFIFKLGLVLENDSTCTMLSHSLFSSHCTQFNTIHASPKYNSHKECESISRTLCWYASSVILQVMSCPNFDMQHLYCHPDSHKLTYYHGLRPLLPSFSFTFSFSLHTYSIFIS